MKPSKRIVVLAVAATLMIVTSAQQVMADPLPGQILKFQQLPMDATLIDGAIYFGHDELSTIYGTHGGAAGTNLGEYVDGHFMADDFADRFDTPVVHVRWWGSYMNQTSPDLAVRRFLISFEADVPADPNDPTGLPFSHPGAPLLNQISDRDADGVLTPGSGTFTEKLISPGGPPLSEALYEYNAELLCPFDQKADTVYWLKIVALVDPQQDGPIEWGWHNRDYTIKNPLASPAVVPGEFIDGSTPDGGAIYHFQDDAVSGIIDPVVVFNQCNVQTQQGDFRPEHYIDDIDGPGPIVGTSFEGIGAHSKDLAFELHTIPEPSTFVMVLLGGLALGARSTRLRCR